MEFVEISYTLENKQQFWDELQEIVSAQCNSHELIDNALRAYLSFTAKFKDEFLSSDYDVSRCSYKLFSSDLFAQHADYIRRQIIYGLLQEDDGDTLHFIVSFLLFDGRQNEVTFQMMNEEGSFPRLLELIQIQKPDGDRGAGLHRLSMDLLYEMARIQRVKIEDLVLVEDDIVQYLFDIIESLSDDANDPYHYPVIRILLVLNEQFMVSAHDPVSGASHQPPTNKVIKILAMHGNYYKTFGENIILLLNREGETSLQLLTLKLLYLIFTTPSTYEYFYTNDLRVLVDILIRNLLDLPEEAVALRHTYLRVFYPLLAHTQLKYPPHYKREEVKRLLGILVNNQSAGEDGHDRVTHFADADETTKRLVTRCHNVEWMRDPQSEALTASLSLDTGVPVIITDVGTQEATADASTPVSPGSDGTISPTKLEPSSPKLISTLDPKQAEILGMQLDPARSSSLSVMEVAALKEKPGVMTPSRTDTTLSDHSIEAILSGKTRLKPEPPKARRSRARRVKGEDDAKSIDESDAKVATPSDTGGSTEESLAPPTSTSRSTSRPPPALPPPRRSFQVGSAHHLSSVSPVKDSPHKVGLKPEPPKTRRWRHGSKAHMDPSTGDEHERAESPISLTGSSIHQTEQENTRGSESVEEAVQKVSLDG